MSENTETPLRPGLFRMLAVWCYDALLLFSTWMVAAAIAVALNGGEAISQGNPFFIVYLLAVAYLFFGWFWTHGGQTLGMRAWRVYLVSNGQPGIRWHQAFLRYVVALLGWLPLGLGHWRQWLSRDKRSWQDIASASRLILIKPPENR